MNPAFIKYLKPLAAVTLLSFLFLILMEAVIMKDASTLSVYWIIPVFYFLLYAAFHYGLLMNTDNGQGFIRYYMAATFIKLFILLGIIIIYGLYNRGTATGFTLNFMFTYLFFMVFEVIYLRRNYGSGRT
ncbi:MAG: hypothetical protein ABI723_02740 [Bacteroidia bacterium]